MKRLASIVVHVLAALGLFVIVANGIHALNQHYANSCVQNQDMDDQENEPFSVPTHHAVALRL